MDDLELAQMLASAESRIGKLEQGDALARREETYRLALLEIVRVLDETRGHFQSRRLGQLRERVQRLLIAQGEETH